MDLFQRLKNTFTKSGRGAVRVPEGPPAPPVRRRYCFSGLVQDVGFRYEAQMTAMPLGLTGWARNENDGTVTIEIQGDGRCVDEFLRVMCAVPRFDITDIQREDLPLLEGEEAFQIQYFQL